MARDIFDYARAAKPFPTFPGKGPSGGFEYGTPGGVFPPGLGIPPAIATRFNAGIFMLGVG